MEEFQRRAVGTLFRDARIFKQGRPSLAGDYKFEVDDFQFYLYTVESSRFDHGEWLLDLDQTRCQLQSLPEDCSALTTRGFDIHAHTDRLAFAFQDEDAGLDTRRALSKFKIRPVLVGDRQAREGQELLLERFFLSYAGQHKPSPDFDGGYDSLSGDTRVSKRNHMLQRYADSLMQMDLYHTDGGSETFGEWKQRGPFFFFRWPKDATDSSTRANLTVKFSQPFRGGQKPCVMLFNQWRSAFRIVHRNGRIDVSKLLEL